MAVAGPDDQRVAFLLNAFFKPLAFFRLQWPDQRGEFAIYRYRRSHPTKLGESAEADASALASLASLDVRFNHGMLEKSAGFAS